MLGLPPTTATYLQEASLASGRPIASTDAVSIPQMGHAEPAIAERPIGIYHRLPRKTGGDKGSISSGPDQRHQDLTAGATPEHEAAIEMHTAAPSSSPSQMVPTPMQHAQLLADVGSLPRRRIRGKTTTTNTSLISAAVQQPQPQETAVMSCQRNITEEHWIRQVATVKKATSRGRATPAASSRELDVVPALGPYASTASKAAALAIQIK